MPFFRRIHQCASFMYSIKSTRTFWGRGGAIAPAARFGHFLIPGSSLSYSRINSKSLLPVIKGFKSCPFIMFPPMNKVVGGFSDPIRQIGGQIDGGCCLPDPALVIDPSDCLYDFFPFYLPLFITMVLPSKNNLGFSLTGKRITVRTVPLLSSKKSRASPLPGTAITLRKVPHSSGIIPSAMTSLGLS